MSFILKLLQKSNQYHRSLTLSCFPLLISVYRFLFILIKTSGMSSFLRPKCHLWSFISLFSNHTSQHTALIGSFIPIYFCHPGNLYDCTIKADGTPSSRGLHISIQSGQSSLLLSAVTAGDANQMTTGIKYCCEWQPACIQLHMHRIGWPQEDPDRWLIFFLSINEWTRREIRAR